MASFYTADLHFGHANIISLCDRPFADVGKMDEGLIKRWNEVVGPDDTVYVVGDVALSPKQLSPVCLLNGRKILVAGNHDSCHRMHRGWRRAVPVYMDAGFVSVVVGGIVTDHDLGGGVVVDLAHLPYAGDSRPEDRYARWRPEDRGNVLLCGHVHTAWAVSGRQINVGVDVHDYCPVSQERVRELVLAVGASPPATCYDRTCWCEGSPHLQSSAPAQPPLSA